MQALIDLFPVVAFVVAYWLTDFETAILVIMAAMSLQVLVTWLLRRTVPKILLGSTALVVVLGGISLALQNDLIFKWKPTVLNWLLAAAFLASQYIGEKPFVQRFMQSVAEEEFRLGDGDWRQLNLMWVGYFMLAGAANIVVAYSFSEAFWVNFKLFGLMGMTVVFLVIQAIWLTRRSASEPADTTSGE